MKPTVIALFLFASTCSCAVAESITEQPVNFTAISLPSLKMKDILEKIKLRKQDKINLRKPVELKVDLKTIPIDRQRAVAVDSNGNASVPFVMPNTMIVKFKEGISESDIESFLQERDARVISVQKNIGTVQIETDLDKYFQPNLTDSSDSDRYIRGLGEAVKDFVSDPRIEAAAPDLLLRSQQMSTTISDVLSPANHTTMIAETVNWGIRDVQADQLWPLPGALDGIIIGVIDVGFSRHEDIVFTEFSKQIPPENHGTHVAGIACAKHDNHKGIQGVLPNCFVSAKTANSFNKPIGAGAILDFMQTFGQTLSALNEFIPTNKNIKIFNISLGYNWMPNFGINPDEELSKQWRALVAMQAEMFISVLRLANNNNAVIFLAAGNDSQNLPDPIDAKFASPMNWAAITAFERDGLENGIIVEAHNKDGKRAGFSNEKGKLSCPGVNILSAVAFDSNKNVTINQYATMSGTSMASPYCASGYALLSLVRPNYSPKELLKCILDSGEPSNSGTPRMRLKKALDICPERL